MKQWKEKERKKPTHIRNHHKRTWRPFGVNQCLCLSNNHVFRRKRRKKRRLRFLCVCLKPSSVTCVHAASRCKPLFASVCTISLQHPFTLTSGLLLTKEMLPSRTDSSMQDQLKFNVNLNSKLQTQMFLSSSFLQLLKPSSAFFPPVCSPFCCHDDPIIYNTVLFEGFFYFDSSYSAHTVTLCV